ncbi:GNAT family N-acetyltransferase [Microbacterium sp.]|uniref:GNAT family N-acetyltransferase n=1 Tax=Microbacterium sp. TaxID=51671 RepID=UPI0028118EF2|nr:GNAT family N-acetyltransferase [Microbacterium sp.]
MRQRYLEAYDAQLRTGAETNGARDVVVHGPLRMALFPGGRGFVTYRGLEAADDLGALVDAVVAHFRTVPGITAVEWKTRGHDRAPGLHQALTARGFVPEEPESIMIGEAALLAEPIPVPAGIKIRRARSDADVWAMEEMQGTVFGDPKWAARAAMTAQRLREGTSVEFWLATYDGHVVSAGRLEPVDGTEFAGLWGGSTLPEWRGRGIYRALTAERARSALALGKRYLQSDSTEFSRPILERSGLIKVSTTTPYVWRPAGG